MQKLFYYSFFLLIFIVGCKSKEKATTQSFPQTDGIEKLAITEQEEIKFQELFFAGSKEKLLGNRKQASEYFERALAINPNAAVAWFELALIKDAQQNLTEATLFAEKAVTLDPENKWYLLLLGDFYKNLRRYDDASEVINKMIALNPENIENYYELASVHILNNDLKKAIAVYDGLEKKYGPKEDIIIQKQKIYLEMNNTDAAIDEIQKLVTAYPGQVKYLGVLAELYQKVGESEKALETYKKINEIDPNNPFVQLSLAEYYERAGEKENAQKALRKAFENPDLDIDTKIKILLNFYNITEREKSELDFALELNELCIEAHPENPKGYAMYGDFLFRSGKFNEAIEVYEKVLAFDKSRYLVWNQLLMATSEVEDYERMASASKEALELFPSLPSFYFFNGVANYQLKDYKQSVNAFETGKEFVFDNPTLKMQFFSNLGDAYYGLQKHPQAFENYQKVLDIEPNNPYILNNYAYYLAELNQDLEKAAEMSKKSNELAPNNPSYLDTYAWILYRLSNFEEAKKLMEKAFASGGKSPVLIDHYGDILYKLGNTKEAKENWEKAFEKDPNIEGLKEKIERGSLDEE